MPRTKGRDYSQLLIWAALAVTIPRYAGAFVASDVGLIDGFWSAALTAFMVISGIGMGFLDVLGMAYVFDGWRALLTRKEKSRARFAVLTGFVIGLAVCGVGILAPFTMARVRQESMALTLPGASLAVWSVLVNIAPLFLIGGVIVGQSGVVTVAQMPNDAPHETHTEKQEVYPCGQCTATFTNKQARSAHIRWKHPKR